MEDFIPFVLFGSAWAFLTVLVVFIIIVIACDIEETGTAAFVSVSVFLGLNYFWGNLPLLSYFTFRNVLIYLFLGFCFSLIRTYFKGKELKGVDKERTYKNKEYYDLKSNVFRWWFLFPVSAINWIFGHLLKDVYSFVYAKVEVVYTSIFNA